jgi:hypothetical protein
MVEVIVEDDLDKAYVIRAPGRLLEIHIGSDMHLDLIKEHLADQISTAEYEKFTKLWSDDQHPRVFIKGENYLKIMDKN